MNWIQNYSEFYEFLAKLLLCAPDDFPEEDYLDKDNQLNLQRAYEELNKSLVFVEKHINDKNKFELIKNDLAASKKAYECGNEKEGAFLIQKIRRELA